MFLLSLSSGPCRIAISDATHTLSCDSLAEWSKALASGASPQGRGFEPHSCHFFCNGVCQLASHNLERRCHVANVDITSTTWSYRLQRCRSDARPWETFGPCSTIWPRGPMDKASAHGAGDCRFESCRGHFKSKSISASSCQSPSHSLSLSLSFSFSFSFSVSIALPLPLSPSLLPCLSEKRGWLFRKACLAFLKNLPGCSEQLAWLV